MSSKGIDKILEQMHKNIPEMTNVAWIERKGELVAPALYYSPTLPSPITQLAPALEHLHHQMKVLLHMWEESTYI